MNIPAVNQNSQPRLVLDGITKRLRTKPREDNAMIVLDHHGIEKTHPMVDTTADGDGVLLQNAKRGRRFTRVQNLRFHRHGSLRHLGNELVRQRRDTRKPL